MATSEVSIYQGLLVVLYGAGAGSSMVVVIECFSPVVSKKTKNVFSQEWFRFEARIVCTEDKYAIDRIVYIVW